MDGSSRLKSHAVPFLADDVPFRRAHPADLLALHLQIAPAIAAVGRLGLQKIARAETVAGTKGNKDGRWKIEAGRRHLPSSILHPSFGFGAPREPRADDQQVQVGI